jgi:hypothetical protein
VINPIFQPSYLKNFTVFRAQSYYHPKHLSESKFLQFVYKRNLQISQKTFGKEINWHDEFFEEVELNPDVL